MTQLSPDEKITAYPPGFRMVAGNPLKKARVYPDNVKALPESETSTDTSNANLGKKFPTIPSQNFRAELSFPSCRNGKDMASADHKSPVVHPDQM